MPNFITFAGFQQAFMRGKALLKYFILVGLFCIIQHAFSQVSVTKQYQNWTQYFLNIRLTDRWSVNGDALFRWKDLNGRKFQTGVRGSISYHFKQPVMFSAGYVYFIHFPIEKTSITVNRREQRPWQQLMITNKFGRVQFLHRYRFEQRFIEKASGNVLTGGYGFHFRARYQLNVQYPINKKEITGGTLFAFGFNEIFVNFGKEIVYNYFDQNRVALGLGYQITKSFAGTLAYQYIWQQQRNTGAYNSTDCIRLAFIHNIDLRQKEE